MRHGPWVRLSRQDKLAQAISGVKALQTGGWHSGLPARGEPHFDRAAIAAQLDKIATWEEQWDTFFAGAGITPLAFTYEELVADLPGALVRVGEHLGLPIVPEEAARLEPRLLRQADAVNAAWREAWAAGEG